MTHAAHLLRRTPSRCGGGCCSPARSAVIALTVAVIALLAGQRAELRRSADAEVPAAGHRPDPADRAADDADHHHRRDRPVGGQHRGPEQRPARRAARGRHLDPASPRCWRCCVGAACGALNGFLVAYVGLPSLAVTIGTLALFRGIAVGLLGTKAVTEFTESWTDLATGTIGDSQHPRW